MLETSAQQRQDRILPCHVECHSGGAGAQYVVPLEPEFIAPQDGAEKQDCESRAARRWLAGHGAHYARHNPVYLGDDLFANQPMCEAVLAEGSHFLFFCKPSSHSLIQEYISGVDLPSHSIRIKRGREWVTHEFRWINAVPLRDSKDALAVNWFEITIRNATGEVTYRLSPIYHSIATTWRNSQPAAEPDGRLKTRAAKLAQH